MFKILLQIAIFSNIFLVSLAQTPGIKWSNKFLESRWTTNWFFFDGAADDKGNYFIAGSDTNWTYDRSETLNKTVRGRAGLIKVDKNGTLSWIYTNYGNIHPGGAGYTSITSPQTESVVAVGYQHQSCCTNLNRDYLVSKISINGKSLWNKTYGGSGNDFAMSVISCSFGGYMVAGYSNSSDGDFSQNKGGDDVWLLRLDASGNIIWKLNYGGSGNDTAYSILETVDKGFLIAGASTSVDGSLSGNSNHGLTDGWLFKVDSSGNLKWSKSYGGNFNDGFKKIITSPGNNLILTGYSYSSAISPNGNKGGSDLWVLRLNFLGDVIWSKTFGGSSDECGYGATFTPSNGCLISGYTLSNDKDIKFANGNADAWLLDIDINGNLDWEKTTGSVEDDFGFWSLHLKDHMFLQAGTSVINPLNYSDLNRGTLTLLGNANSIRGFVFFDANKNVIKDNGETPADNLMINISKDVTNGWSAMPYNGFFNIDVDTGTYKISASLSATNPYFSVVPVSSSLTYSNYFNIDTVSFALTPNGRFHDLRISLVSESVIRPGFAAGYKLLYENVGTDTITNGKIKFVKSNKLSYVSAIPTESSIASDTIVWQISQLKPFEKGSISINCRASVPPVLNIGDTVKAIVSIEPNSEDQTPTDDSATVVQLARGSFDPNDKSDNFNGKMLIKDMQRGLPITYLIRFQNTGTDTAFTVVVRDTLQNTLDPSTFQMIGASHAYNVQIRNNYQITWTFENILLPDSNTNEKKSHGYLLYNIRPKSNIQVYDIIKNSASIYFDYNLPVTTNEQQTILGTDVVTANPEIIFDENKMLLFPNPTSDKVIIAINENVSGKAELTVTNIEGKLILKKNIGYLPTNHFLYEMQLNNLNSGVYFIKLSIGKKNFIKRLIVI